MVCALSLYAQEAVIRWTELRQPIDGFGACDAWYTEEIMTHPDKEAMLDILFKRDGGAGLSILRHRLIAQPHHYVDFTVESVTPHRTSATEDLATLSPLAAGESFQAIFPPIGNHLHGHVQRLPAPYAPVIGNGVVYTRRNAGCGRREIPPHESSIDEAGGG
jgi:hypothetical protein